MLIFRQIFDLSRLHIYDITIIIVKAHGCAYRLLHEMALFIILHTMIIPQI